MRRMRLNHRLVLKAAKAGLRASERTCLGALGCTTIELQLAFHDACSSNHRPRFSSTPAIQGVLGGAVLCSVRNASAKSPRWFTFGAAGSSCTFNQHSFFV